MCLIIIRDRCFLFVHNFLFVCVHVSNFCITTRYFECRYKNTSLLMNRQVLNTVLANDPSLAIIPLEVVTIIAQYVPCHRLVLIESMSLRHPATKVFASHASLQWNDALTQVLCGTFTPRVMLPKSMEGITICDESKGCLTHCSLEKGN